MREGYDVNPNPLAVEIQDLEFGPTVLVIDDDSATREYLEQLLERRGFQVAVARGGAQGIAALARLAADAVLTDILMPEKDGLETIGEIRRRGSGAKIVAMSGGGTVGDRTYLEAALRLGADAGISKPFDGEALLRVLSGVLGGRMPSSAH